MGIHAAISRTPMNRFPPFFFGGGAVDVFHHAPPIYGVQNAEMKKKKFFCDVIASVLYNAKKSCLKAYDRQPCNRIKA